MKGAKRVLGAATVGALVASVVTIRLSPSGSYDRVVLVVGTWLQLALLASLYSPIGDDAKALLASLSHFGFLTSLVYGVLAADRPTLILCIALLCFTMASRLVLRGCMYSVAEEPRSRRVRRRASWVGDWQLLGVLAFGVARLRLRWRLPPDAQALCALLSSVGTASSWSV